MGARHRQDLTEGKTFAEDFLKKTEARYQGGTVAKLDVIKARVDLAQADNALIANERAIATARAALNRQLGRPPGGPIEAADDLSDVPPPLPGPTRRPGSAISGMPILDVDQAKSIIVVKRSMGTGYAGIDNELYANPKTSMYFADAKRAVAELTAAVKTLVG